ncbi:MAG TPA: nuclear transport factor 2 family protein [Rhizomicrobium sp.]|jgi:ketosteroid isomerase-like protein|nr:nuclear transport factor 2 family protein [Rhizomicrobium sp.]
MDRSEFAALVQRFSAAATAGDGKALAECFTPDGVYYDYIYGPHAGRASIVDMLENLFHRDAAEYDWTFYEPVTDGRIGYAHSLSTFISKIPDYAGREIVINGISRFVLKDGLIAEYHESVNGGVAQAQLGIAPERMAKVMARWAKRFRDRPDVESYAAAVRARYAKAV